MAPHSTETESSMDEVSTDLSIEFSRRRALFHLRILSVLYILFLIGGTHWPKLDLSGPTGASDKLLHFLAFGLFVFMVRLAGWSRRFWSLVLWGLIATITIEYTQHWLPIGRYWSLHDILAGMLGVLTAPLIVMALEPVGGTGAQDLRRRWFHASYSLLARVNPCMNIVVTGTLGFMIGGILGIPLYEFLVDPFIASSEVVRLRDLDVFILGGLGLGIPATIICFLVGHASELNRFEDSGPKSVLREVVRTGFLRCLAPSICLVLVLLLFYMLFEPLLVVLALRLLVGNDLSAINGLLEGYQEFLQRGTQSTICLTVFGLGLACFLRLFLLKVARIGDLSAGTES